MKRQKCAGCQGQHRVKLRELEGCRRGMRRRALIGLLAAALAVLGTADAWSAAHHKHRSPHSKKAVEVEQHKHSIKKSAIEAARPLPPDLAAAKQAIELVRQHKMKEATTLAAASGDPVVAKLVEWVLLRQFGTDAGFDRYISFIRANPDWPSMPLLRRRAEVKLWQERRDSVTVRHFIGEAPSSPIGRLALARIKLGEGARPDAESDVRAVWQSAELSAELETAVLAAFPNVLTPADHLARMDRRIGAKDFIAASHPAKRVGPDQVAIVKACIAAEGRSHNGRALLDAVRAEARKDLGYALCRLHWLLRNDMPGSNLRGRIVTPKEDIAAAVRLTLSAPPEDLQRQDTDEWWRERRVLARKLIDLGDPATAYQVARGGAPPANPYYRAEFHFMAGWIALRFLDAPTTALEHFAHIADGMSDPITLARGAYWRGRAAEATGQVAEMRTQYEAAARYPTAYYGQLARARLGLRDVVSLRSPPEPPEANSNEVLHAADILYQIGEGDLVLSFMTDLAGESSDDAVIAGLGTSRTARVAPTQHCAPLSVRAMA
jgi:peptidoglycan lytic transglycosylase